jgi:flagellin-like hook-associated protein FlgL
MALRINTNVTALVSHRNLVHNDERLSSSIEKLSSGLRINRAADDAAGLTISEKLRTQVRGINRAILNVQDGISMIQTAEGALNETHSMLQRMRELAIQASNDTLTTTDRLEIQKEIQQLKEDIDRIAYGTEFNTKKLLDGSGTAAISTSDPKNLIGVPTGEVMTFSDFSVIVWPQQQLQPDGSMKVMRGTSQVNRSAIFTRVDGVVASGSTTLQSISNFYDNNGNFLLELPQTLFLQGNNSQGKLTVSKDLTMSQLAQRLQQAQTTDQLGIGLHFDGSTTEVGLSGDVAGQITMTSGKTGLVGRMNVTGEQALVTALGFQEVIKAEDPVFSIMATDLSKPAGARTTNSLQIAGNRASGLIHGVDLIFTPPTQAFADTKPATLGISLSAALTFNIEDADVATAGGPIAITIPAGQWGMDQVRDMINTQIAGSGTNIRISAAISLGGGIQFKTPDTGSSAYITITNTLYNGVAANPIGIGDGVFRGSGGTSGQMSGSLPVTVFDYSTAAPGQQDITITDRHALPAAVVNLAGDYSAGGMVSLVDAINIQLSATPNVLVKAFNDGGRLAFKSLESGELSNFLVEYPAGPGGPLFLPVSQNTSTGANGYSVKQDFQFDTKYSFYGYNIADNTGLVDDLAFRIMDEDGKGIDLVIAEADPNSGTSFKRLEWIISSANTLLGQSGVKVAAEKNPDNSIKFYSSTPGKTGKVTLAEQGAPGTGNSLRSVFDLAPITYQNGVGDYGFTTHIKDQFVQFQVGPNEGHFAKANMIRCDTIALNVHELDLTNIHDAQKAIGLLDKAIQYVSSERAKLGAVENRMTYTASSLRVALENMSASESRIRDVDMAREVVEMTRFQILQQSSNAMLGQANATAQRVLDLLR